MPRSLVYLNAFVLGFALMGFEMVASRFMYPFFGGSIETWSAIISTTLLALMTGYFIGGLVADRFHRPGMLGWPVTLSAFYIAVVPLIDEHGFQAIAAAVPGAISALLASAMVILWVPVALIGMFTPCALRLLLTSADEAGTLSGRIYGISTLGNVAGTLATTFLLIPRLGSAHIAFLLAVLVFASGMSFFLFAARKAAVSACILIAAALYASCGYHADAHAPSPTADWDGQRAMHMIAAQLSFGSRALGTAGHRKAIDFIIRTLEAGHATIVTQRWTYKGADGVTQAMTNIIARFDPSNPRRILLGTHYDSIARAYRDAAAPQAPMPGANNSASGVALLLETARLLPEVVPHTGIDMVFFDGEEGAHSLGGGDPHWTAIGSSYFAQHLRDLYPDVAPGQGVIFDMVCYNRLILHPEFFSGRSAPAQVKTFWDIGHGIAPEIFSFTPTGGILDDNSALARAGIPGFLVIGFDYAPWFNTTQDTLDKCSAASLEAVGRTLLAYLKQVQ